MTILLFIIAINLPSLYKSQVKAKTYWCTNNMKMEKNNANKIFDNIKMLKFGKTKVAKNGVFCAKKTTKSSNVNTDNIFISKSIS